MGSGTDAVPCKLCGAPVRWAKWVNGKAMPVDAHPVRDGNLVLTARRTNGRGPAHLVVATYNHSQHGTGRNRYVSHFVTCPNAAQHRKVA